MILDRVPPHSVEAEAAVLGACLLDAGALDTTFGLLSESDLYTAGHRKILRAVGSLYEAGATVDIVTTTEALRASGDLDMVGGPAALTRLVENVMTTSSVDEHCRIIRQKSLLRQTAAVSARVAEMAFNPDADPEKLLDEAERQYFALQQGRKVGGFEPVQMHVAAALKEIEAAQLRGGELLTGITTGFGELDAYTGGYQKGDLIIVQGRPGQGKTAYLLSSSLAVAHAGTSVGIVSLEMTRTALVLRLLAQESRLSFMAIRRGRVSRDDWTRLAKAAGQISKLPLWIDDSCSLSANDIRSRARKLKAMHGVGLMGIDYLGLMDLEREHGQSETSAIGNVTRGLKQLAKELSIPVVLLVQLSRATEKRGKDTRPRLSDSRDSGFIEQDADLVLGLYREEYYHPGKKPGEAEVLILKQRNGPTLTTNLVFNGPSMRFDSRAKDEPPEASE